MLLNLASTRLLAPVLSFTASTILEADQEALGPAYERSLARTQVLTPQLQSQENTTMPNHPKLRPPINHGRE
jgi:hypothetical protein